MYGGAHWRHLVNTIEPSVCGGDAVSCQITLITCCVWTPHFGWTPRLNYALPSSIQWYQNRLIVSVLQRLHGEIGRTNSDVRKRDGQTDRQTDKQTKLETVSIAEPLQTGSMRKTPNAVNSRDGGRLTRQISSEFVYCGQKPMAKAHNFG